jgi:DNA-binding MarR family transcriptional regulator
MILQKEEAVGRNKLPFDEMAYFDMASVGMTQKDIAQELGLSIPTLERNITELSAEQGVILKYRELQSLQLTKIQAKILDAITPDKIAEASLHDLVVAFKVLKDKELVTDGKPNEIHGLVGYLIQLEKAELAASTAALVQKNGVQTVVIDGEELEVDDIPNL